MRMLLNQCVLNPRKLSYSSHIRRKNSLSSVIVETLASPRVTRLLPVLAQIAKYFRNILGGALFTEDPIEGVVMDVSEEFPDPSCFHESVRNPRNDYLDIV
jgi:hypothetical protein